MRLYDGASPIEWASGTLTVEEMRKMPELEQLLSEPSVLIDNGDAVVDWMLLSAMCAKYEAVQSGDAETDFAALVEAMEKVPPDRAEQALEMAESAQQTADEAKATAGTAAASVNEYMDALLGLSATDETEANDAE